MRYTEVGKEELSEARPGLMLVERVSRNNNEPIYLYLYGLTSDSLVLTSAYETLIDGFDEEEETEERSAVQKPTQVAVCIPLNSDTLYYLTGSGLLLQDESFAYMTGEDGARKNHLSNPRPRPRMTLDDFTKMAISDDESWLDDFLTEHGAASKPVVVKRDQQAVMASKKSSTNVIDHFLNP